MRSLILDITGNEADFQLQILNDEELKTRDFDVDVFFADLPDGSDPELFIQQKTGSINPDGSLNAIDDTAGTSELAELFELMGAPDSYDPPSSPTESEDPVLVDPSTEPPTPIVTIDPPDTAGTDYDPDGDGILDFNSDVGVVIGNPDEDDYLTEYQLDGNQGTVEAWIYVDEIISYAGILHKGIEKDWSDESYSLQFWGNKGQIAFAAVVQEPKYKYDKVVSSTRIQIGKWYYIAATWDAETTDKMWIFIYGDNDGNLELLENKSAGLNYTKDGVYLPGGPLVIGSQLADPDITKVKKYYGTDGKINGVRISQTAKSVEEITAFYEANKTAPADNNW
jgi:hypothetical protein